jgi:uncharacterized membrane protein
MLPRSHVLLGVVALLTIVGISIAWQLVTSNYPTHSDVFIMGLEAGVLAVVLLLCLFLNGFLIYRLIMLPSKKKERKSNNEISKWQL